MASAASTYTTKDSNASIGTVTERFVSQRIIDITVDPTEPSGPETEIVLRVNGRVMRRLTDFQARRMGLVRDQGY